MITPDGNGSFTVTKTGLGLILALISIISIIASVVAQSATVKNEVSHLTRQVEKNIENIEVIAQSSNQCQINQMQMTIELKHIIEELEKINKKLDSRE